MNFISTTYKEPHWIFLTCWSRRKRREGRETQNKKDTKAAVCNSYSNSRWQRKPYLKGKIYSILQINKWCWNKIGQNWEYWLYFNISWSFFFSKLKSHRELGHYFNSEYHLADGRLAREIREHSPRPSHRYFWRCVSHPQVFWFVRVGETLYSLIHHES